MLDQGAGRFDLFIIGGGMNGCGIARDAAGRGFSAGLAEQADLGSATSSASTKLFHCAPRYLQHCEFRPERDRAYDAQAQTLPLRAHRAEDPGRVFGRDLTEAAIAALDRWMRERGSPTRAELGAGRVRAR